MRPERGSPDLYVLDALSNDIEDLESILRFLNSETAGGWKVEWGKEFQRQEVLEALLRLIARGCVRTLWLSPDGGYIEPILGETLAPGSYDDFYFEMTGRGRMVHSAWEPPS